MTTCEIALGGSVEQHRQPERTLFKMSVDRLGACLFCEVQTGEGWESGACRSWTGLKGLKAG